MITDDMISVKQVNAMLELEDKKLKHCEEMLENMEDEIKRLRAIVKEQYPSKPTFNFKRMEDEYGPYLGFDCPVCSVHLCHPIKYDTEFGKADGERSAHCNCWDFYIVKEVK